MATRARRARDFEADSVKTKLHQTCGLVDGAQLCAAHFFFLTSSYLHAFIRDEHAALPVEKAQIAQVCDVSALAQPRAEAPGGHWQPQARFQPQRRALLQVVMLS
jgi:hypothetical protein